MNWIDVGAADDYVEDAPAPAVADGHPLAVFRLGDELFALRDKCSHGNARLSDGYIEDGCVECPLHQGLFDIRSGAPRSAPCTVPVRSFPVRVVAGRVEVDVAEPGAEEPALTQLTARIGSIERVSSDVAVLRLEAAPFAYRAGQYLDVLLADGQRRSYSMAAPSGAGHIELHVRHMPGGLFTDRVFGELCAGHPLTLEGPGGDFYLRDTDAPVILLASGTGFAPVKALIEHALATGNTRPFHLYWGGRRAADLYMDALCRQWADTLPWLQYTPVLSDAEWHGRTGLVHRAVLADYPNLQAHEVYACGAPAMVAAARADFSACGLTASNFYADAFLSQADLAPR